MLMNRIELPEEMKNLKPGIREFRSQLTFVEPGWHGRKHFQHLKLINTPMGKLEEKEWLAKFLELMENHPELHYLWESIVEHCRHLAWLHKEDEIILHAAECFLSEAFYHWDDFKLIENENENENDDNHELNPRKPFDKVAYKLFRIKDGKLYPLYVFSNEETPMGKWIPAKCGPRDKNGKVHSRLGTLAYRPGWHLAEFPAAKHIGHKSDGILVQSKDTVWCEVEYSTNIDYTDSVRCFTKNGGINHSKSYMKEIPVDGFYEYKTNPLADCRWLIAGSIKVNRILTGDEIDVICRKNNVVPQIRERL